MNRTGKAPYPPGTEQRIPDVRARLKSAPNGYLRGKRFSRYDRYALWLMQDLGEVEKVSTVLGTAYRLIQ